MNRMQELLYPDDPAEVRPRQTLESGTPGVNPINAPDDLLQWLRSGWSDLWQAPVALLHGLVVSAAGVFLLWATWGQPWLGVALIFGFLLLGPVLAVGVNDLARRLERGERTGFRTGLGAIAELGGAAWIFAAGLAALFLLWASFVWLWIGVMNVGTIGGPAASPAILGTPPAVLWAMLSTPQGIVSLIGAMAAWAVFALAVFALSVVTLPAMLDRRRGLVDAVATSLRALRSNLVPLLFWGLIITALFAAALVTGFIALIVIFPWLGFAMWHGYRAMVRRDDAVKSGDASALVHG
ncbi:Protein of unknown function DUF2189, transmembrane [Thioalkalivibrio nitratireducens DSM 14787]|uniref:DUF2189 domain-containing protein n=1 Tax=Thioalkalivibrio nitratireducens (strain DSM 14787 / UNIQEM 213 / ALEN2) TaxID=1255043 RepID=L0E0G6_THIND|nr:DUF2189 domain-containing protein [Thioalkalivibrio nitratireducens]AGA35324.1 Protein of unknown function DUF2189, transmembrane [Thioalkalivibrio nitratireducens DSM 14787]